MNVNDRVKVKSDSENIPEFLRGKEGIVTAVNGEYLTVELEGVGLVAELFASNVEVVPPPPRPRPRRG